MEKTYTGEFGAAVTALGRCASLLDVQVSKLAAGGLDHADFVRDGVVWLPSPLKHKKKKTSAFNHLSLGRRRGRGSRT